MKKNLKSLQIYLKGQNSDVFYLPSFDHYMSEYVPATDSLRVHLSGFKGSVAEALIPADGKLLLYVDGRYHEQADLECDLDLVEVVKVPYGQSLMTALKEDMKKFKRPSFLFERTQQSFLESLEKDLGIKNFIELEESEVAELSEFKAEIFSGSPWEVSHYNVVKENLFNDVKKGEAYFINALDTLAYASGLRANFLPYQGTFRGVGFLTSQRLWVFIEDHNLSHFSSFETEQRSFKKLSELEKTLREISNQENLQKVYWDSHFTSAFNFKIMCNSLSKNILECHKGFYQWHSQKTEEEVEAFRTSFEKSDKAIYNGLCWLIEKAKTSEKVSELQFRDKVEAFYKNEGAKIQSFRTISGFGASSSIIHFGSPSAEKIYNEGEFVLLDSGAIYEEGFATDCTRTIIPSGKPSDSQKLHYTLVLKGLINILRASVPKGTAGKVLDEMARAPLKEKGLNFAHGTGHGVGVNVHESGYSVTPISEVPLKPGVIGSMEPGFYEPGVGGIRLENIVYVKEDPTNSDNVCFESLVHIGFWGPLIEQSLLDNDEKAWLENYEKECQSRGRSFEKYLS